MSWAGSVADKSKNIWNKTTDALAEKGDFVTAEGKKPWDKTSNILCETKNSVTEGSIDVVEKIRLWLIFVLVKAIHSCSAEQERLEVLSWLALVREIIANPSNSFQSKAKDIYHLLNTKKTIQIMFRSVVQTVKNYKNADLPLTVKIAIPATSACFKKHGRFYSLINVDK